MIGSRSDPSDPVADPRGGDAPLWTFALVLAAAVVLRFWGLRHAGISHWDAGTYTAGPLGVGPYGEREIVLFQTPPLVPAMFGEIFEHWGAVDTLAMAAIALLGVATVAALFLAGRRWVGGPAALTGAAALAGTQLHVLFSRQALTDVPFALCLLLAAWAFTAAVERRSLLLAPLSGFAGGAAILTKYHGFLALVLPALWLAALRFLGPRGSRRATAGSSIAIWLVACAVAAVPAVWLAREIDRKLGLEAFLASRKEWLSDPGLYLLPMTAKLAARTLWEWVSPVTLAAAALGLAAMARRRSRGDLYVLAWIALFVAVLPLYRFYPRLLVPVLPPIALAAGVGLEEVAKRLAPRWKRGRTAVLCLAVFAPAAWPSRSSLSLEDRGYELAARYLTQSPRRDPRPDLLVTQHSILFYLADSGRPFVCYDQPGALETLEKGDFRFLVGDIRLVHAPEFRRYLEEHAGRLKLVAEIGNPMPETTVVNSAGFEGLDALRSPATPLEERKTLATIRVWRPVEPGGG